MIILISLVIRSAQSNNKIVNRYFCMANENKIEIDSFKLGDIAVSIRESNQPEKYEVSCNDGMYVCNFTIRRYEYENYNKLMKTRIRTLFKQQHNQNKNEN